MRGPLTSFAEPAASEFRGEVQAWLAKALPADWRSLELQLSEDEQMQIRRTWDRKLFEAGFAGLSWPKRFGGQEAGAVADTIFHEELANAHAPEGLGRIGRVMAGPLIMHAGTQAQQERFLPGILDGSQIWCLGFSEPQAGSDLAATATTADRDGGSYRITGRKIWTSHAHYADRCVLLARSSREAPKRRNISVLLLDLHQAGIEVSPIITAAGDHHFNEVTFDGAVVPAGDRLGPENEGWRIFREGLAFERGVTPALNHYIEMRRECEVLLACCGTGDDGAYIPERSAALSAEVELIRWHIMRIVELDAAGQDAQSARLVLKLWWSELWQRIADFGSRLQCPRHRQFWNYQYLQSRAASIYAGTSEIQRNTIARHVLREP